MGPGLYSEIGKKARDLLYKDYHTDQKFTITTYTSEGVAITASGTRKHDLIFGEIHTQLKRKNWTVDVKANSDSDLLTTITADEIGAPGLKAVLSFVIPDQRSGKLEFQYLYDYAGINGSIGLAASPFVNLCGVLGSKNFSVGADVSFDTATGNFSKYNAGLSMNHTDLSAAITLNNQGDTLTASYYHLVNPLTSTAIGGELSHSFSRNESTLIFGTQHQLDALTILKARLNNYGMVSTLVQHEWRPKSFFTISAEVDTRAIDKSSKVGLSLLLKP